MAQAVETEYVAFHEWRTTPLIDRVQYLSKLKGLLEEHLEEIAKIITNEYGKTYKESIGEMWRGTENVEVPAECRV